MFSSYTEFEIEIQPRHGDIYPVAARGPAGEENGILRSPGDDPAFQQLCTRLAIFDTDEELLLQIGTQLYTALFQQDIGKLYAASRSMLKEDQGIVIRLRLPPGVEEIAALPWEFVADPDSGPLAMLDAPVARYLPQPTPLPSFHTTLPLKVLLTGAQTAPPAEIARELQAVEAALQGLGEQVKITIEPHLTTRALRAHLRKEFHIWHFVGHGGFDKAGKTAQLLFEDQNGEADPVSAMELNIMLNRSGLRLVVLNACDSGKLVVEPFHSIAPALIRAQVPAVVAHQFNVPEAATREFVADFYRSLAEGFPIDACITEGRKAVMNSSGLGQADWGIPVLYTRMANGRLFDLPEVTPAALQPASAQVPLQPADAPVAPTAMTRDSTQVEALIAQLQAKRREQFLLKRRNILYIRPQAHHIHQAEQLASEIRALTEQLQTLEDR